MYLVELGSGIAGKQESKGNVSAIQRYRPIRSIEEIDAEANEGDQSGLDVVLGNYRSEAQSFEFSVIFDFISYAFERVRGYFKAEQKSSPPETWYK